ncbi:hypothetical protein HFC70_13505 [Agrobacterium sp. a22-2]|uniref:hypothetical protein n=1 Tax=Agrobacterium sp. a22-2 TaxID=2283840 RepID=UPI001445A273|nr:hypothetical protein [Agrobacterium sp. a22-2]NKN37370.1 hypothetical protein [Agrobacterium sp. a22-2]
MGLFAFLSLSHTGAAHEVFQNCLFVEKPGLLLARCEGEDRGQIATQHDYQFRTIGHEIDAANADSDHKLVRVTKRFSAAC